MAGAYPRDTKKNMPPQPPNEALTAGPRPSGPQQPGSVGGSDQDAQGRKSLVPQLSLPKGGGAIRGIGEKFDVNPATGTGGMSIPIATTPGRAGFGPELALSYDSGGGNGPFGLGWGLSVPSISRKTDKGLPRYRGGANEDTFVLSGAEDLVPLLEWNSTEQTWEAYSRTEGSYRVTRYRPRVEGTFARIECWAHTTDATDVYWKATTPDNVTSTYGKSSSARLSDPADASHVFSWLLEETRDDRGNVVVYQYKAEDLVNVPESVHEAHRKHGGAQFSNHFLKRILYGNKVMDTTSTSAGDFFFEVVFDYGEHTNSTPTEDTTWSCRQDPYSTYRAGFEVRTYRLCQRVLMFHRFEELETNAAPRLVRATELSYDENPTLTRLSSVTARGYADDLSSKTMPSLDLTYSDVVLDQTVRTLDAQSMENLPAGLATAGCQLVDLDGEGAAGVLCEQAGGWTYKANLGPQWQADGTAGTPRFGAAQRVATQPARSPLASGYQLMDLGGDGKLDLVQMSGPMAGYSARTPDGAWEPWRPLPSVPNVDRGSAHVHVVDLTGDGLGDLVVGEDLLFRYYPSKGREGFDAAEWARKAADEDAGPQVLSSAGQELIAFADMSGDGLSDVVRIRNRQVCYWPNLGYGRFGARVVMSGVQALDEGYQFDPNRVRLADIDGSGTTDIIYLHAGGPKLLFNQAGNSFSTPQQIYAGLPAGDGHRQVQVADILGRGTAQLVWSSPLPGDARSPLRYIDLMAAGKPHLLTEVENNLGATTRVRYAPSTRFYLEDKAAGKPWITRMAFPVHVVSRVETYDGVSKTRLVTTYRYRHGYFDGHEREFRGFGYVEQRDAASMSTYGADGLFPEYPPEGETEDESHLPPVVTRSWYHTGAWLDRQDISAALATEYFTPSTWTAPKLADTVLPAELPAGVQSLSVAEQREACRALKGQVLRQEVYAEDGSADEGKPYSVTESNAQLRLLQPASCQKHSVFAVAAGEKLSMHFERNESDPRVTHELALEVDDYGNMLKSAQVQYPRRGSGHDAEQQKLWILVTEQEVFNSPTDATPSDPTTWYRVGVPVQTRTCELTLGSSSTLSPSVESPLTLSDLRTEVNDILTASQQPDVIEYHETPSQTASQLRVVEHVRQVYTDDNQGGSPLALGTVQSRALPWAGYKQAFTSGLLSDVYGSRVTSSMLATDGGYVTEQVSRGDPQGTSADGSYWLPTERQTFAASGFYQPTSVIDPFGNTTTITYDGPTATPYYLAPAEVTDPAGNTVSAELDYRVMAPWQVTDENDNVTSVKFDALGMVVATAQQGKDLGGGSWEGDTLAAPTTELTYDLDEYKDHQRPVYVYTKARETHQDSNTRWLESYSYSDGLGREVSRKVLAEPGDAPYVDAQGQLQVQQDADPRWVGTGRTVFDNKGNPIKQYEPFFSTTSAYEDEEELTQWGVTPILRYDPQGRLIRTDLPNGTHSRVDFDAWEQESWDENDTVVTWDSTHTSFVATTDWYDEHSDSGASAADQRAASLAAAHAGTPTVTRLDSLGRPYLTRQDKGSSAAPDYVDSRVVLDIEGNTRVVVDARARSALITDYDMLGSALHTDSIDAGERWALSDVAGQPIYAWDSREHRIRTEYDALRRPSKVWVKQGTGSEWLAERLVYGELYASPETKNLRGRLHRHYDGAGLLQADEYDFKGNQLSGHRRMSVTDDAVPDWSALSSATTLAALDTAHASLLETETFTTQATYDALNRPVTQILPDGTVLKPGYNEAGLLEAVDAQVRGEMTPPPDPDPPVPVWTPIVTNIDYNARGQRASITYGCGATQPGEVTTSYTYDPETFRLTGLKTDRSPDSKELQDLSYTYDPVGNIVAVADGAHQDVYFANNVISASNEYEYDPLYRLTEATGREFADNPAVVWQPTNSQVTRLSGIPDTNNPQRLRTYTEQFTYDVVGNLLQMAHQATNGNWTRHYKYEPDPNPQVTVPISNRLHSTSLPGDPSGGPYSATYTHDDNGNMATMPHLSDMDWDHNDQLLHADLTGGGDVYFQYDAAGNRVRKLHKHNGATEEERIYLGGYEVYRKRISGSLDTERETVHVMDDQRRVAMVETKTWSGGSQVGTPVPKYRYQLDNHLGTACVELDGSGYVLSYEEYHPYGGTAYHSVSSTTKVSDKRYRYTGKERDEETGLYYHGARYYAAWLGRWTAADPAGMVDGANLYLYARNRPIEFIDAHGTDTGFGGVIATNLENKRIISEQEEKSKNREANYTPEQREAFRVGKAQGEVYGQFSADLQEFNEILTRKWAGVSLWDRLAPEEKIKITGNIVEKYRDLPELSSYFSDPETADFALRGFNLGSRTRYSKSRLYTKARNLALEMAPFLLAGVAAGIRRASGSLARLSPRQAANWNKALAEAEKRIAAAKEMYGDHGILNMAISRKQALNRMEGLSVEVEKHLAKIASEPTSQAVSHWQSEIRGWLQEIERLASHTGKKTSAEWMGKVSEWSRALGK